MKKISHASTLTRTINLIRYIEPRTLIRDQGAVISSIYLPIKLSTPTRRTPKSYYSILFIQINKQRMIYRLKSQLLTHVEVTTAGTRPYATQLSTSSAKNHYQELASKSIEKLSESSRPSQPTHPSISRLR